MSSMKRRIASPLRVLICCLLFGDGAAGADWRSITLDNDIFVGSDSGYTNGLFFSWYNTGANGGGEPEPPPLIRPLLWSLPARNSRGAVRALTVGQAMVTPEDITLDEPQANDLPYSGFLFVNDAYLAIDTRRADLLSTTLGIVGPSSGAEPVQRWIHRLTGSDEPKGWDSQLKDEVVFKFLRARLWRAWASRNDRVDLLLTGEAGLGTLDSAVSGGLMLRYGEGLTQSFAVPLLSHSKISSPVAVRGGWYVYVGLTARRLFNQIFTDGNTFHDSPPSVDVDKNQLGATAGFTYSWQRLSLTLAVSDANLAGNGSQDRLREFTRYGTLTVAWTYE